MAARREWLLVRPRADWTVGGVTHPAGALLATRFDDFLAGGRDFTVLFAPGRAHRARRLPLDP